MKKLILTLTISIIFIFVTAENSEFENLIGIERADSLITLADELAQNDPPKSISYCEEALSIISENNLYPEKKAETFTVLSSAFFYSYDNPKSLEYCEEAIKLYEELEDQEGLAKSFHWIGIIAQVIGDYDRAIENFSKALELNTELKDAEQICYGNYYLGVCYMFKNEYSKNLKYNLIALELVDLLEVPDITMKSRILNQIGRSYEFQNEYEKALEFFNQSMEIMNESDHPESIANRLHSIAMLNDKMGNYEEAVPLLERALKMLLKTENKIGISYTYQNLGIVLYNAGLHAKSEEYFKLSLPLFREFGARFGIATVYVYLGRISKENHKFDEAILSVEKGLEIAEEINQNGLMRDALLVLSDINSTMGNYKKALSDFKKATAFKDSVYSEEKNKSIAEMQTKYETEKKEQENKYLTKKNEFNELAISRQKSLRNFLIIILLIILISMILVYNQFRLKKAAYEELEKADKIIREQKNELEILNKTRNRFFSIISHDLKNSISSLQMGTKLLKDTEFTEKEELNMISDELYNSTINLSKFLENLLEWARIQIGRIHHNPTQFDVSELINEVTEVLSGKVTQKEIRLISEKEEILVSADKDMIYSVVQNLISNALKFTNIGGEVVVSAAAKDNFAEITFTDNGMGMSQEILSNLFKEDEMNSVPGTAGEKGTGLGLLLCKEFIEKNSGEIKVESEEGEGTTVKVFLPVS
jgi:signal transduction histidine kinase